MSADVGFFVAPLLLEFGSVVWSTFTVVVAGGGGRGPCSRCGDGYESGVSTAEYE